MSASLLFLITPAVLAAVLLPGFVGCDFDRGSDLFGSPLTQYSAVTIDGKPVSYWPLGEPANALHDILAIDHRSAGFVQVMGGPLP